MRILAVDTATETCGVALAEDTHILAEIKLAQGLTHARVIMDAIRSVLQQGAVGLNAVDGFVVTRGPGSFTGLRIGISTIKGLAAATGKPLVGVSTLAVLAHQAPAGTSWICPMIDARRREVYWSVYQRRDKELLEVRPERVGPATDVSVGTQDTCLFIGNGAALYAPTIEARFSPAQVRFADAQLNAIQPGIVARLGAERLRQGPWEDLHRFTPVYLRKSDAEMGGTA